MALRPAAQSLARGLAAPRCALAPLSAASSAAHTLALPQKRSLIIPSRPLLSDSGSGSGSGAKAAQGGEKQGLISSLLRGSDTAKAEGQTMVSHSTKVARGKYIHEIQRHEVRPEYVEEYKKVLADYYPKIFGDDQFKAKLTGSWEVAVGDLETFYHIWQYDGYAGYDASVAALDKTSLRADFNAALRPFLKSRSNWLCQEFAFWPTAHSKESGGIYELRTYHLQPGKLLEWEQHWRKGLEARRRYAEPVGAWFTQIGGLHTVFHIWHYPSLEKRKETRDAAWQVDTWNHTVSETVKLIDKMHAQIMTPLPFSPLR